ncbi:MFS transporter [Siminovitchia sp. FSL H7-0308]|uniref:MFS transporter n=1 Tax=unclassified Siminovitchia TaxID=2837530 RepID=UPI0030CAAD8E
MNLKVFILAAATIGVGLVELIVGGILPVMADDLQVNLGTAGQLISVFALIYAVSGPVLLSLTAKIERKRLYLIALFIFFLGNVMTYFSPNFLLVMVARVITAMSTALVVVLSLTITAKIVEPAHRARALGFIYMGISSSLVLGVPIGIIITDHFGWRTIFLGIAFLSLMSIVFISLFLERIPTERVQPLSVQIKSLGNIKIASAHLATMFMLAGHYTLYAYFTPFLETAFHLNQNWISICYLLFGLSAICGGALGGALADRIGSQKSILLVISSFAIVLFLLPYSTFSFPLFLVAMMLWGALSWSLAPPQQNYIIQIDPDASDIHQSINNSALQIGISLGSAIGGVVLERTSSLISTAHVGAGVVVIALICGIFSLARSSGIDHAEM